MNISRRTLYESRDRSNFDVDKKVNINFNLDILDLFCAYVISENKRIRKTHLINLRNMIMMLDMDNYQSDIEKMKRIDFVKKGLEAKLVGNLSSASVIIAQISGGLLDEAVVDISTIPLLSSTELEWVTDKVTSVLNFKFIYENVDYAIDLFSRFKNSQYDSIDAITVEIENFCDMMKNEFRKNRVDKMEDLKFTLRPGAYEECMRDAHETLSNPGRRIKTGLHGLNELLNGGFEAGRAYMFLGLTGVGKSLLLINLIMQMKKANTHYVAKDPTKIPVIVMLTQENSVLETIQRIWNIAGNTDALTNYTVEEVIHKLKTDGELFLSDASPIDIIIKYKGNRTIDTSYLYTLCDDLEDEGYEVIAIFQDHVKRIKSAMTKTPDIRIELGEVVNEMKLFAQIRDIPIITVSHLNRDAAKIVDSNATGSKADLTKLLSKANVGESLLMLDNIDFAAVINIEYDSMMRKHIIFSRIKMREKSSGRDYIAYEFEDGNDAKIIVDFMDAVPKFKETLKTEIDMSAKIQNSVYSQMEEIDDDSEDRSIFDRMTSYNSENMVTYPSIQPVITDIVTVDEDELPIPTDLVIPFIFENRDAIQIVGS